MSLRAWALLCAVLPCAYSQTPAEQTEILSRMRVAATGYGNSLQDFTCTKLSTRSVDPSGTGKRWKLLETQEQQLNYVSHKETYRLLKVNGDSIDPQKRVVRGYTHISGEFGSLDHVFDPKGQTQFEWDHAEPYASGRLCVFRYRVPQATSTFTWTSGKTHVQLAYHGTLYADCESGLVMRLQLETDPGSRGDFNADIHYGFATIASKQFLLPVEASDVSRHNKAVTKIEVKFQDYRKYDSNSQIKFGEEEVQPKKQP